MTEPDSRHITRYLSELESGDEEAVGRLLPHVYEHLRALAVTLFQDQQEGHTLQPTALVHEVYMRLVGSSDTGFENRRHFYRVAAMAMRQLLIDHARTRGRQKRGGGAQQVELDEELESAPPGGVDALALAEALGKLRELEPRQAEVAELRFLVGLTAKETAEVLGVSERTIGLDWAMARSFLEHWMSQ